MPPALASVRRGPAPGRTHEAFAGPPPHTHATPVALPRTRPSPHFARRSTGLDGARAQSDLALPSFSAIWSVYGFVYGVTYCW